MIDIVAENKQAAQWLLYYHERLNQYKEELVSFSELSATAITGMPHGTSVSRPTDKKGITLAELDKKRLWLITVEDTEKTLSEKKKVFLYLRRQAVSIVFEPNPGRPGWVDYVQAKYAEWHHRRFGGDYIPSDRTMRAWWEDIVNIAVRIAIRRGVL